ncbi:MAG: hypothetical protein PHX78_08930 [bacterium]|nr:hypothetical protein [bacterium]
MEAKHSNKIFLSLIFASLVMVVGLFFYNALHDPANEPVIPNIDVPAVKAKIKDAGLVPVEAKYYKELK